MPASTEEHMRVKDGFLEIRQKIDKGTPSGSGKSLVFFSTKGNREIADGYVIGVNLYKPNR